jgi:hypothetical protein
MVLQDTELGVIPNIAVACAKANSVDAAPLIVSSRAWPATQGAPGSTCMLSIRVLYRTEIELQRFHHCCRRPLAHERGSVPSHDRQGVDYEIPEDALSLVSSQCLGTRRIPDLGPLASSVNSSNAKANRDHTCIRWNFTRKSARTKFSYERNTAKRSET